MQSFVRGGDRRLDLVIGDVDHPRPRLGVTGRVTDHVPMPQTQVIELVAGVGMDPEVVVAAIRRGVCGYPLLMVAHQQHPSGGLRQTLVDLGQLGGPQTPGGLASDRGVEQPDRDSGQLDPLVAGVPMLALVGIVIAADDVQEVSERLTPARFERRPLLVVAIFREITLDDHGVGLDQGDLGGAARFMVSGYGGSSGPGLTIGPSVCWSITPHSVSPKCTSLTVAKRAVSEPGGRGSVRAATPCNSNSVSGGRPS